jgi:transglutaminase-like putative cysteine protease
MIACALSLTKPAVAAAASRTFTFTYSTVVRDFSPGAGKVEVWLPFPQSDAYQTVHNVRVDAAAPVEIAREPRYGNEAIHLTFESPAAKEIPITVTFTVTRKERKSPLTGNLAAQESPASLAQYLQPDRLVPSDGRVRELALEATKGKRTQLEKARAIYDYVTSTVKYDKSGTGWGQGDALFVCDERRGNCTDFHALLIGMARSVGIPAKFAIGFPLPAKRGEGEIGGYHCWAEMYVKDIGWVPVDSSEASKFPEKRNYFFGAHDENRVQLSMGRDLVLQPRQKGEPLNYFVYPYVEVDGKPHTTIDKKFAFQDVASPAQAASSR